MSQKTPPNFFTPLSEGYDKLKLLNDQKVNVTALVDILKIPRKKASKLKDGLFEGGFIIITNQGRDRMLEISEKGKLMLRMASIFSDGMKSDTKKIIQKIDGYDMLKTDTLFRKVTVELGVNPYDVAFQNIFYLSLKDLEFKFRETNLVIPDSDKGIDFFKRIKDGKKGKKQNRYLS